MKNSMFDNIPRHQFYPCVDRNTNHNTETLNERNFHRTRFQSVLSHPPVSCSGFFLIRLQFSEPAPI
jgi:hypothetical protein